MVTLYWRPGCVFCMRLRAVLRWHRLRVRQINIWHDADAAAFVHSVSGGSETVPTVVIDGRPVVNPAPGQTGLPKITSTHGLDQLHRCRSGV